MEQKISLGAQFVNRWSLTSIFEGGRTRTVLLAQLTNSPAFWQFLSDSKDAFGSIESVCKILAVVIGGIWAWRRFGIQRKGYPCAELSQEVKFWDLPESTRLVRVTVTIKNPSETLLLIFNGHTWVQQMKPWPEDLLAQYTTPEPEIENKDSEIPWPLIKEKIHDSEKELEPKESDVFTTDFIIDKRYEQVLIYTWIENSKKPGRNIGWSTSTDINFKDQEERAKPAPTTPPVAPSIPTVLSSTETAQSKDKVRPSLARTAKKKG